MLEQLSEGSPVMHSEKAIAYFKRYTQRGIDEFGKAYKRSVDELADMFARQPLDIQRFLSLVRHEDNRKTDGIPQW